MEYRGALQVLVARQSGQPVVGVPDVTLERRSYGFDLHFRWGEREEAPFIELKAAEDFGPVARSCVLGSSTARKASTNENNLRWTVEDEAVTFDEGGPATTRRVYLSSVPTPGATGKHSASLTCRTDRGAVARNAGGDLYLYTPAVSMELVGPAEDFVRRGTECLTVASGQLTPDATVTFERPEATSVDGPYRAWSSCSVAQDRSNRSWHVPSIAAQYHSNEGARREVRSTFVAGVLLGTAAGAVLPTLEAGERAMSALRRGKPSVAQPVTTSGPRPSPSSHRSDSTESGRPRKRTVRVQFARLLALALLARGFSDRRRS